MASAHLFFHILAADQTSIHCSVCNTNSVPSICYASWNQGVLCSVLIRTFHWLVWIKSSVWFAWITQAYKNIAPFWSLYSNSHKVLYIWKCMFLCIFVYFQNWRIDCRSKFRCFGNIIWSELTFFPPVTTGLTEQVKAGGE